MRDGHTHYPVAVAGKCPYCRQKFPAHFEEDIAACFDAQHQQDIRDPRQFGDAYHDEVDRLNKEADAITARGRHLRKDIRALSLEISELNERNANTEAAIESINKILMDSGLHGFSLRASENDENVYEVIREAGSVAENLSEGERNFIAFLYFYHHVRGRMNSEERKEKIVDIDGWCPVWTTPLYSL